jgi:hypothetical protein
VSLFAGMAVADYPASRGWYELFFGRPPDLVPNDNEAAWQVAAEGWVYIVGDSAPAGNALGNVIALGHVPGG